MGNVVVYCRISSDTEGLGLGVKRQQRECTELCERQGWTIVEVATDNDISAFKGKRRPGYQRALELIGDGTVDGIVAWHPDRLHRSPRELEDFIDLIESTGAMVATVQTGEYDLSTPAGRTIARVLGAVARGESEHKSARAKSKHAELARAGKAVGGGLRAFGFERGRTTHHPIEAPLVREAANRVLAGESLYSIRKDWEERDVATVTGAPWSITAIRTFLLAPRIAGIRSHNGEEIGKAEWDPILDEERWRAVVATLTLRSRSRQRVPRSYLLTGGIARCGACGEQLEASPRDYGRAYGCSRSKGCGGVTIKADPLEEYVVDRLFAHVESGELGTLAVDVAGQEVDDLDAIGVQLDELADMFSAGELTRPEWARARAGLIRRQEAASEAQTVLRAVDPTDRFRSGDDDLRSKWGDMGVDLQRSILAGFVDHVTVTRSVKGGPHVDLGRVSIGWRS